jgi:hypothetical protein
MPRERRSNTPEDDIGDRDGQDSGPDGKTPAQTARLRHVYERRFNPEARVKVLVLKDGPVDHLQPEREGALRVA